MSDIAWCPQYQQRLSGPSVLTSWPLCQTSGLSRAPGTASCSVKQRSIIEDVRQCHVYIMIVNQQHVYIYLRMDANLTATNHVATVFLVGHADSASSFKGSK